jgi:hypothetical protein
MSQFDHVLRDALNRVARTPQQKAVILGILAKNIGSSLAYVDGLFIGEVDPTDAALAVLPIYLPVSSAELAAALRKDATAAADAPYFSYPAPR